MKEVGFYWFVDDSDAWSAKAYGFKQFGSADVLRRRPKPGFDVYRYDATAPASDDPGRWLSPAAALARTQRLRAAGFVGNLRPYCDLRAVNPL